METAQQAVKTLTALWLEELQAGRSDEANVLKKELKEAKKELKEAKKELKEAEQKYNAKASVQAGRGQAGASACAVVAVAFDLQHSRMVVVRFRAVQPFLLFGVMLSSQQGFRSSLSFTVLACSTSGSGRGSWLLQVQANLVALCVLPFFRTGCQSQARGGGVSLFCAGFALALRSFSRLRLFVSEARLSGYCVREGGVKGVNPGCL